MRSIVDIPAHYFGGNGILLRHDICAICRKDGRKPVQLTKHHKKSTLIVGESDYLDTVPCLKKIQQKPEELKTGSVRNLTFQQGKFRIEKSQSS